MAENPEILNKEIDEQALSDGSTFSLLGQIEAHRRVDQKDTALDKLVQLVYDPKAQSFKELVDLKDDIAHGRLSDRLADETISRAVKKDNEQLKEQNEVSYYAGSFLKAVPLFAGPKSRMMMAGSIGLHALDAVHEGDSLSQAAANATLGGLKGAALKATFDHIGQKSFKYSQESSQLVNKYYDAAVKGSILGTSSRFYESGFKGSTYLDENGQLSLDSVDRGLGKTISTLGDGKAIVMDAGLFMVGNGAFNGLKNVAIRGLESSPMAQKLVQGAAGEFVNDSKLLNSAGMGATFGFSSGATGEYMRQRDAQEGYDLGKIVKRGAFQSIADGAAGGTGATFMHGAQTFSSREKDVEPRLGRSFAGKEQPVESGERQVYQIDSNLKPTFEKGVAVASRAVKAGADSRDVLALFEFCATEGQAVKPYMEQLAQQAGGAGNKTMQKLINAGLEGNQHSVTDIMEGLDRAQAVSGGKGSPELLVKFLEFAYGPGKGVEGPLRMIAEASGDKALNQILQEAYAGSSGVTRDNVQPQVLQQEVPENVKESFRLVLKMPTGTASEHVALREKFQQWLQDNPDYDFLARRYGEQTRNGLHASIIDGQLGTNYLQQFPHRSLLGTEPVITNGSAGNEGLKYGDSARASAGTSYGFSPEAHMGWGNTGAVAKSVSAEVPTGTDKAQPQAQGLKHEPGNIVTITPEVLVQEFRGAQGSSKQGKAHILSEFTGKMGEKDFADWMSYLHQSAHESGNASADMHPDINNLALMHIANSRSLMRPEIVEAMEMGENGSLKLSSVHKFLSAPEKVSTENLSDTELGFIGQRMQLAMERARLNETNNGKPVDDMAILKDALPGWYIKSIRENFAKANDQGGYDYPADFDPNLVQWLETHRAQEMQNPRFRTPRVNSNTFSDRLGLLDQMLELQKTSGSPEIVDRLMQLGGQDQFAAKNIAGKLDPATNAPEYKELLALTLPHAKSIQEMKVLFDAIHFGKKAGSDAFKAKKDGRDASYNESAKEVNQALALTTASRLVPHNDPNWPRVEQIINEVISGRIRDPRPGFDDNTGPGMARNDRGRGGNNDRGGDRDNGQGRGFKRDSSGEQTSSVDGLALKEAFKPDEQVVSIAPVETAGDNLARRVSDAKALYDSFGKLRDQESVLEPVDVADTSALSVVAPEVVKASSEMASGPKETGKTGDIGASLPKDAANGGQAEVANADKGKVQPEPIEELSSEDAELFQLLRVSHREYQESEAVIASSASVTDGHKPVNAADGNVTDAQQFDVMNESGNSSRNSRKGKRDNFRDYDDGEGHDDGKWGGSGKRDRQVQKKKEFRDRE
jgi:hypothetical protein